MRLGATGVVIQGQPKSSGTESEKVHFFGPGRRLIVPRRLGVATGRLIQKLVVKRGECNIEKNSVYGAAILIPQLARSASWPKFLTAMALRSFQFHLINLAIQSFLLVLIAKETNVMNLFGGQMYLCDFGAFLRNCPDDPICTGPKGTPTTAPRQYGWDQWVTRVFARDSLIAIFPEKKEEIMENMDVGEYGVESYWCRWVCCFIYMLTAMSELTLIHRMWQLLYYTPTKAVSWINHREEDDDDSQREEEGWLGDVEVKVDGMPASWKVFNFVTVFTPKCVVWMVTAQAGVLFLMETASINNLIVNSVALSFVLNIDEMICETLMSDAIKHMLQMCEEFKLPQQARSQLSEENLIPGDEAAEAEPEPWRMLPRDLPWLVDIRLVSTLLLTVLFVMVYYCSHCDWTGGRFVSKDMYLPKSTKFGLLNAFFPHFFPVESDEEPYWTMPPLVGES